MKHLIALSLAASCGCLLVAQQESNPGIVLVGSPVLIPDDSGSATALLHLRNEGAATKLAPSVSDFEHLRATFDASKPPKPYSLGTTAILTGVSNADQKAIDSEMLEAGKMVAIKLTVTHLWEAGASRALIYNGGAPLATVKAVRVPAQYNIQIIAKGDPVEIHFKGAQGRIQLKNLDPMNYDFNWELRVGDQTGHGWVEIPANSVTTLDVSSAAPAVSWLSGLLKEPRQDGDFLLKPAFEDVHQPAATKIFPVKVRVSWAGPFQELANLCFVILLLILGGTVSIWVNWGMPNTSRALAIRKTLWEAQTKVNGTGELIAAKWRVVLAAQLEWVLREMKSVLWIFPSFSTTLDAIEQKTALLEEWIDIAYEVAVIRELTQQAHRKQRMPPTLLRTIEEHCEHALEPLETGHTNAEELRVMHMEVATAQALLKGATGINQVLEQEIGDRERRLLSGIEDLETSFGEDFGNLIDDFKKNLSMPLKPPVYTDRDIVSAKILILNEFRDCIRRATPATVSLARGAASGGSSSIIPDASNPGTEVGERLQRYHSRLFEYLRADSYESLCMARVFLEEMHQDIYADAMEVELSPEPRLAIVTEPRVIEPGAPVRCSLLFSREVLNDAVARQEWTCVWDFGDSSQPRTGWAVFHTFPEHGTFTVQVRLHGLDARPLEHKPIVTTLRVDPPGNREPAPGCQARHPDSAHLQNYPSAETPC